MEKLIELRVAESLQNDVGRGIVRIDTESAEKLGVSTGDIIEIEGKKKTCAKVWQARQEDEGAGIIRMDGLIRQNSESSLGDKAKVKKARVEDAKTITISPTRHEISFSDGNFPSFIKHRVLLGKPFLSGDMVPMPGLGGQTISFTVTSTKPKGIVRITEETEVNVKTKPMSADTSEGPEVRYEDIGGLKDEVSRVREMIELPMKHPELFDKIGIKPPKGVLLYGPPGTGKTLLAKAVASESNAYFLHLNGPEIMDKYYGESERKLREIFEEAQANAPSIIFIDELDSIAPKRDDTKGEVERRVVAQLLALMDGLVGRGNVIVVAATNRPDSLDPALRRPGRFDREIEIGVPDRIGRKEILQIHTRGMPLYFWDPQTAKDILLRDIDGFEDKTRREIIRLKKRIREMQAGQSGSAGAYQDNIEKAEKHIKDVNSVRARIRDNEALKNAITKAFEELSSQKEIIEAEDIAPIFSSQQILGADPDAPVYADKLSRCGIIGQEYVNQVISESKDMLVDIYSGITHGFVGADLSAVAREAAMHSLKRALPKIDLESEVIPTEVLESLKVIKEDFDEALKVVEPSALREVYVEVSTVKWQDIGGLEKVKSDLIESVEWPLKKPESFKRMGINPPKAILLYGPPGCGKTLLAKAVANESDANFISVKGPELLSKWVGESEKAVREIFKKARQTAPTVIFFDEIDAIAPLRGSHQGSHVTETVVNQILTELDGIERLENVMIIGATNRPDIIDPSLLRPGRFDRLVLVPLPDKAAREEIVKVHARDMPLSKEITAKGIALRAEGFSGADIESLCREAAMAALRQDMNADKVLQKHFDIAFEQVEPSVTTAQAKSYEASKLKGKTGDGPTVAYT